MFYALVPVPAQPSKPPRASRPIVSACCLTFLPVWRLILLSNIVSWLEPGQSPARVADFWLDRLGPLAICGGSAFNGDADPTGDLVGAPPPPTFSDPSVWQVAKQLVVNVGGAQAVNFGPATLLAYAGFGGCERCQFAGKYLRRTIASSIFPVMRRAPRRPLRFSRLGALIRHTGRSSWWAPGRGLRRDALAWRRLVGDRARCLAPGDENSGPMPGFWMPQSDPAAQTALLNLFARPGSQGLDPLHLAAVCGTHLTPAPRLAWVTCHCPPQRHRRRPWQLRYGPKTGWA